MSGDLKPHDQLPSERQLSNIYGISRHTAHKAVDLLLSEGLVYREHGKGVYVSKADQGPTLQSLSFTEQLQPSGLPQESRLKHAKVIEADDHLAGHLQIDVGAKVYVLHRLRVLNGKPIGIEWSYLPLVHLPGLADCDLSNTSIYEILEKELNVNIDHAEQTICARVATTEEAEILELDNPGVVLELERKTYDTFANIIEYCLCAYHPERYTLTAYLSRK